MIEANSRIEHCNHHGRIAGGDIPGGLDVQRRFHSAGRCAQIPLADGRAVSANAGGVKRIVRSSGMSLASIGHRIFDIVFDFIDHRLVIRTSGGAMKAISK